MASYRTIKQKNPSSEGRTATDFHVMTFDPANPPNDRTKTPKLNVKGFNGVKPDDAGASYRLDGDGTDEIDISEINVGGDGEVSVRLQSDSDKFPKLWVQWTDHNVPIGSPIIIKAELAVSKVTGTNAIAALHQIIDLASGVRDSLNPQG
jgi:hypothetical protein